MRLRATNDPLIEELINSPNHIIKETGEVFTNITRTGKVSLNNVWRDCIVYKDNGYQAVQYKGKKLPLHRIVYRKFKGELKENLTINHLDGNPTNNHIDNLELVTQSKNNEHSYRVLNRVVNKGNSKITKEIAEQIREDYKTLKSFNKLAEKYSLAKTSISYIINNKIWK
jgi:hypothetical protein